MLARVRTPRWHSSRVRGVWRPPPRQARVVPKPRFKPTVKITTNATISFCRPSLPYSPRISHPASPILRRRLYSTKAPETNQKVETVKGTSTNVPLHSYENEATSNDAKVVSTHELSQWNQLTLKQKFRLAVRLGKAFASTAWQGTKVLYGNLKKEWALKKELKEGKAKMNRELYRFLRQNSIDIWRLVPILLIWKVPIPFSGSIIPFLVITYPHLLPSTFKFVAQPTVDQLQDIIEKKRRLYLGKVERTELVDKLANLWADIKMPISIETVHEIAKVFEDVPCATSDKFSLSSTNLRALLAAVAHPAPGGGFLGAWPQFYLAKNWWEHWCHLKEDDSHLLKEGIDKLSNIELVEACLERGLKVKGLDTEQLRDQLSAWLKLSSTSEQLAQKLLIAAHAYVHTELWLKDD